MPVEKLETRGSGAMSYDNTLGNIKTRLYMCDLDDAPALWAEYSHNTHYPSEGGYFIRTRSSIANGECYSTATLVFAGNPDLASNSGAGGNHEDGDTEYAPVVATMEKPLEQHPNYRTNWNYELLIHKDAPIEVPTWWLTAKTTVIEDDEERKQYEWVKPGTRKTDWNVLMGQYYEDPPSTVDFRGVETWVYPSVVMTETKYFRKRDDAANATLEVGRLKAPNYTGPYLSANKYWLVESSTPQRVGKYWAAVSQHRYADRGWNSALYVEA